MESDYTGKIPGKAGVFLHCFLQWDKERKLKDGCAEVKKNANKLKRERDTDIKKAALKSLFSASN